jgi:hypothetical protein
VPKPTSLVEDRFRKEQHPTRPHPSKQATRGQESCKIDDKFQNKGETE